MPSESGAVTEDYMRIDAFDVEAGSQPKKRSALPLPVGSELEQKHNDNLGGACGVFHLPLTTERSETCCTQWD